MATDRFRDEIAAKFRQAIAAQRISKTRAAGDLGISRQMLYEYLAGRSAPKQAVLQRACAKWGLELNYKDFIVTAKAFRTEPTLAPTALPLQLDLLSAVEALRDEDLEVRILRKDRSEE